MPKRKECAVKNCCSRYDNKSSDSLKYFSFPSNNERFKSWIKFCENPKLDGLKKLNVCCHYYICEEHFKQNDFTNELRQSILRNSVPSIKNDLKSVTNEELSNQIPVSPSYSPQPFDLTLPTNVTPPPLPHYLDSSCSSTLAKANDEYETSCSKPTTSLSSFPASFHAFHKDSLCLANIRLTRRAGLTSPTKRYLYDRAKKIERALKRLKRKYSKVKKGYLSAKDLSRLKPEDYKFVVSLSQQMSSTLTSFFVSQLRCAKRKPKGRRWTNEEKVLALSVFKKGPKVYRLLRCMFTLPCKRTLSNMLQNFPFVTGINEEIFLTLTATIGEMNDYDKLCCLIFDEMAISEHLSYNSSLDLIDGVEDHGGQAGSGRTNKIASHALVFMVSGLLKKWKQPIAYYFSSKRGVSSKMLVKHITSVLHACNNAGLCVVATVCDLGGTNIKALNLLGSKKDNPTFTFERREIVTIFDPSHLIKCTRNMLLKNNVKSTVGAGKLAYTGEGEASWQHIVEVYERDKVSLGLFRTLWKLTDSHFAPQFKQKLRVKLSTQVLSHSVAAAIMKDITQGHLDENAMATAYFVELCDQLFDSFNGTQKKDEHGKKLKCWITTESPHLQFWNEVSPIIDGWQFESNTSGKIVRPWSQDGWLITIKGMTKLWELVSKNIVFETPVFFLVPRNVSQDALENMFGSIRGYCGNNNTPNVRQFVGALKTCIVNGLAYRQVRQGFNCEDDGTSLLSNLQTLLSSNISGISITSLGNEGTEKVVSEKVVGDFQDLNLPTDLTATAYVSGFIARRILANNKCKSCRLGLLSSNLDEAFLIGILFKEYTNDQERLTYPSEGFVRSVGLCATLLENMLGKYFHEVEVLKTLTTLIKPEVDFSWLEYHCHEHCNNISTEIVKSVCKIGVPWWCKKRNREMRKL